MLTQYKQQTNRGKGGVGGKGSMVDGELIKKIKKTITPKAKEKADSMKEKNDRKV